MSDSDDDWFNKDENEIVQNLQQQVKQLEKQEQHEEHIVVTQRPNDYIKQLSLDNSNEPSSTARFGTGDLPNALKMQPLDMFFYFMTDARDLFANQLRANDSQKRLLQYVEVVTRLCQMELGGFDDELVSGFANQIGLLNQMKVFAVRLFTPPSKGILDDESEQLLRNIKWLLLRAHKLGVLGKLGYELIEHFKTQLAQCQLPHLLEHPLCVEFAQELAVLPTVNNLKDEIYPKLDELQRSDPDDVANVAASDSRPQDAAGYISWQRQLLREDFALPLREFVKTIRDKTKVEALINNHLVRPNTRLILNPEFADAEKNNLIFVNISPTVKLDVKYMQSFKNGALLCFTTSYDFDNLILATVGYTSLDMMKKGYLSVEIIKQYNIGKIYDIPLIMFETPVFFEPYLRVHNYLTTCSADNFPMRLYIIDGCLEVAGPACIDPGLRLNYNQKLQIQLNASQKVAIDHAFTHEFCLIQGPPGTGKTHLSVELLKVLLDNAAATKTGPIIVLTYTNDSLDKFLLKASEHTDSIIRFGSQSRLPEIAKYNVQTMVDDQLVPPRLKRLWWLIKCEYKDKFERLQTLYANFDGSQDDYVQIQKAQKDLQLVTEKRNTLRIIFQYYVARNKALLAMTTSCGARLNYLFRLLKSKCLIFEEAAETAETHVLACLTPHTEHVILVGDHKQLQPYTGSYTHQGLQISLFERLIVNGFPVAVLDMQYRMRPCIAELLVPIFYDALANSESVKAYDNVRGMAANMYFVNHKEPEEQLTDMSFVNKHEALKLVELLRALRKYYMLGSHIVILSPYNAQVEYIKLLLPKKEKNNTLVATVDSYQGLEANIVLLSLVRSNAAGQIGFLRLPNRVCVALSRARWGLYMIGNMETLQRGNHELWGAINSKLEAANAIGEEFPLTEEQKVSKTKNKKNK
ncbi:NFX1-type zinc finger-containing protein 1 [Drosophila albomicans]|uniref:NFX1-type zinc finger-containing protein 1 n=1 Tax=Drosophila albomicans TaxID=7291 RepID=A0A6P8XWP8_DROAB|nr:NFX1-type zinc finger-containing protein 1 [Drosophila albomicans]